MRRSLLISILAIFCLCAFAAEVTATCDTTAVLTCSPEAIASQVYCYQQPTQEDKDVCIAWVENIIEDPATPPPADNTCHTDTGLLPRNYTLSQPPENLNQLHNADLATWGAVDKAVTVNYGDTDGDGISESEERYYIQKRNPYVLPGNKLPLVVFFHGMNATADFPLGYSVLMSTITGIGAHRAHFISIQSRLMCVPGGFQDIRPTAWEVYNDKGGSIPNTLANTKPTKNKDFIATTQIINNAIAELGDKVDTKRIYLIGHSVGSTFAAMYGIYNSDKIAAVVQWSGGDPWRQNAVYTNCGIPSANVCPVTKPEIPSSIRKVPIVMAYHSCDIPNNSIVHAWINDLSGSPVYGLPSKTGMGWAYGTNLLDLQLPVPDVPIDRENPECPEEDFCTALKSSTFHIATFWGNIFIAGGINYADKIFSFIGEFESPSSFQ